MKEPHLHKNFSARQTTGKKWRGFGGGNFLPACFPRLAGETALKKGLALFQSRSKIIIWILLIISSNFIQN